MVMSSHEYLVGEDQPGAVDLGMDDLGHGLEVVGVRVQGLRIAAGR